MWSVMIFTIALTLNGAVTGGYLGNGLDIAPNFSGIYLYILIQYAELSRLLFFVSLGTIFGMANTLSSFGGFLSSYIVGKLTNNNVSIDVCLEFFKNCAPINKSQFTFLNKTLRRTDTKYVTFA